MGVVTFGWINWNILNPQVPTNLLQEAAAIPSLAREKNFTWLEALQKPHLSQAPYKTMPFSVQDLLPSFIASGVTRVSWENTFPTRGGNNLYDQNDDRTRIIRTGRTCVGVLCWERSTSVVTEYKYYIQWGDNINLQRRELANPGAVSCDVGFSLLERKPGVVPMCCWDGL